MRYSLKWFDDVIGYNKTITGYDKSSNHYYHYDIRGYFMIFKLLNYRLYDFYHGSSKL